jgi:type IV pilus assembly protein PilM
MSQKVIGLDVGSTSVRVAIFRTAFRKFELVGLVERHLSHRRGTHSDSECDAEIGSVIRDLRVAGILTGDAVVTTLPGDRVASRVMNLPFTEAKQITSTLGFELENFLPYSVDDLVFDYSVIARKEGSTKLMATAVERDYFEERLALLQKAGTDPRFVGVGSLSFIHLVRHLPPVSGTVAVVDLGSRHTDIAVFNQGVPELTRTVLRGGDDVTRAIAEALGTEFDRAEAVKLEEGVVTHPGVPLINERQEAIAAACRKALEPLVQRIHMTLQARMTNADTPSDVVRIYLCGGGAQLRGIYDYLEAALEIATEPFPIGALTWNILPAEQRDNVAFVKAIASGLRATAGASRDDVNFRLGQYAYKGDFEILRGKLIYVGLFVAGLLGVASVKAFMQHSQLEAELSGQYDLLASYSKELTGKEFDDFSLLLDELNKRPDPESMEVFPELSATKALFDITTIMQDVSNTSRAEVLKIRGEQGAGGDMGVPGAGNPGTGGMPGVPPTGMGAPGAGEALDPTAAPNPFAPPGGDPLFPDGPPGVRPPGPAQEPPPLMDSEALREERARRLREFRERRNTQPGAAVPTQPYNPGSMPTVPTIERPDVVPSGMPTPPTFPTPTPERPRGMPVMPTDRAPVDNPTPFGGTPPMQNGGAPPAGDSGAAPTAGGTPTDAAAAPVLSPEERLSLELESLTIEEGVANLKGEANSIEAVTLLEQKLKGHPCFKGVVLEGTERITFERHRDWYSFRIKVDLNCKAPDEARDDTRQGE